MKLFMILALPLSLVYTLTKSDEAAAPYASVLTGLVLGALYSFVECMFTSSYYLIRYAFFPNYAFYLFFEVVLPCLFCTAFYLIFTKKHDKILLSLYFVFAGFYAVYMPARVIHRNEVFDWYLLFVKPLIYTAMVIGIKNTALLLHKTAEDFAFCTPSAISAKDRVKPFIFPVSVTLCVLIIPPAVDVMHLLNLPIWTILPAALVYCTFAVFAKKILRRS
ncbi:hypothetical protein H0R92_07215 [Treponema sp. OMZ 840]|uniref:hypothetical protein n=1 Tax=Treponema sp. OMZ 840 TaxID=244313 RepID=UPI003D8A9A93